MKVQEKLKNMLIEAGLSEVEIVIYFELLKKPSETKWNLINRTGLDRNCVYRAFEKLEQLKMVKKDREGIKALSLKPFVDGLLHSEKRLGKLADKIRKTAPFLRVPTEAVEEFDVVHFQDQILDNYMMMSKVKYNTCLDFGDLENFVPVLGGMEPVLKFRENRYKQSAKNKAICTTFGPYTSC
ncbi:MAG: helix-turn-helix domain-containing protein, partial [Candidatus Gracilibacteria bacterium]